MEKKINFQLLSIFILASLLIVSTLAKNPLFIFGDSILDAGNNNYINTSTLVQANIRPYGITFFHFPTGRFSDGRIISDFIAEHANLPFIPPFLQPGKHHFYNGVNFASAAAGALAETNQGLVIDFHMQLQNYKKVEKLFRHKFGEVEAKKRLTSAVYLFSIGANDYLSLFLTNSSILTTYTKSEYVELVIGNITSVITEIYNTGGRKFAFLNVPKIGCVPVSRISNADGECNTEPSEYAMLHNRALFHVLEELKMKLPGFKYSFYDFYTCAQQRIDYPSKYGFKEGKTACCGTGKFRGIWSCGGTRLVKEFELCENVNDYVFWDSTHFTEKVYEQLADEMWNLHSYGSHSIKELFYLS
ncbi:GDSL esterase/lipase 5-like [Chenopodium quinoa]|uniref:Uncharacterized protein n=1 Tax=Chenopodium quinoa TaxID=63459 RepID=A0A803LDL0_CHEQI|nr:GDSL esterase/lipase 5-like [Chenopodium quinoa]